MKDKNHRPYNLIHTSIPLGHDVKHNSNAGNLLPTVIEWTICRVSEQFQQHQCKSKKKF